jgi:MOSC domain-containing protein YiiM
MPGTEQGRVAGLAVKRQRREALEPVDAIEVTAAGIAGNVPEHELRRITLIAREDWEAALAESGGNLPWYVRRANILVEGLPLAGLIRRAIAIGPVRLRIHGETEPCGRMEQLQRGLYKALNRDCRGGVYGSVLQGGTVRIGETVRVLDGSD